LDYLDFKRIAFLVLEGKYLFKDGKDLINRLANTMNNKRLSTYKYKSLFQDPSFTRDIKLLEESKPLVKIDSEGRAIIISTNKYIRSTYIIEATLPDGELRYFPSGVTCAKALSVSNSTIMRRLNDGKSIKSKENILLALFIRRIRIFVKH
jgi:hypothetical protein